MVDAKVDPLATTMIDTNVLLYVKNHVDTNMFDYFCIDHYMKNTNVDIFGHCYSRNQYEFGRKEVKKEEIKGGSSLFLSSLLPFTIDTWSNQEKKGHL